MTELKTLKDLRRFCSDDATRKSITGLKQKTNHTGYIRVVDYNELKAEAVKWVKEFRNRRKINKYCEHADDALANNFELFFNLTEGDLK